MQLTAENAYGVFRRQFSATFAVEDAAQGIVSSYGTQINGASTSEVDAFARDFPGANATVFVAQGEDFRRITTSVKKENGERAIGTLLDRKSAAYPVLRSGKKFIGRVMSSLGSQQQQLFRIQQQLAAGTKFLTAADDPVAAARALGVSQSMAESAQYATSRSRAMLSLSQEETALKSATSIMAMSVNPFAPKQVSACRYSVSSTR